MSMHHYIPDFLFQIPYSTYTFFQPFQPIFAPVSAFSLDSEFSSWSPFVSIRSNLPLSVFTIKSGYAFIAPLIENPFLAIFLCHHLTLFKEHNILPTRNDDFQIYTLNLRVYRIS